MIKRFFSCAVMMFMALMSQTSLSDALKYESGSNAEITKIAMYQKNVRKASDERLVVFDVTVKNVDAQPHMYSVTVVIPGVGAGEGFAPAKGEELVQPDAEGMASVAVLAPQFPREGYSIMVKSVDQR